MPTVAALFENTRDADKALEDLASKGFQRKDIGVLVKKGAIPEEERERIGATEGAEVGALTGGIAGGTLGLLVGLGALAIPGVGWVIATGDFLITLGTTVLGAGAGAIGGGLIGALVGLGLPHHEAEIYAEGVKRGNILITIQATDDKVGEVSGVLRADNAVDVNTRRQEWESQGWSGFQPAPEMPEQPTA